MYQLALLCLFIAVFPLQSMDTLETFDDYPQVQPYYMRLKNNKGAWELATRSNCSITSCPSVEINGIPESISIEDLNLVLNYFYYGLQGKNNIKSHVCCDLRPLEHLLRGSLTAQERDRIKAIQEKRKYHSKPTRVRFEVNRQKFTCFIPSNNSLRVATFKTSCVDLSESQLLAGMLLGPATSMNGRREKDYMHLRAPTQFLTPTVYQLLKSKLRQYFNIFKQEAKQHSSLYQRFDGSSSALRKEIPMNHTSGSNKITRDTLMQLSIGQL